MADPEFPRGDCDNLLYGKNSAENCMKMKEIGEGAHDPRTHLDPPVIKVFIFEKSLTKTRMHSSRMRTGRSLTVCWSLLPGGGGGVWCRGVHSHCLLRGGVWSQGCLLWGVWSGGVSAPGGVCSGGGVSARWGYIPACTEADPLPPCGQTDACENITLAQLRCGR